MYSITPLQYSEPLTAFGYFMLICAACTILIALLVFLFTKHNTFMVGFSLATVLIIFGILSFGASPTPAPEIEYDVTAMGRRSEFSINRPYITSRGVSKAVGRPVGNAGILTCDDKQNMESGYRPVSYLSDEGTILRGMLKVDRNGSEWKITLTDSKGKAIPRPSHKIGTKSELSVTSNDDEDSLALMADNGAKGCRNGLVESRYSISHASTVIMRTNGGTMVSITDNHSNGGISMDDGMNPAQPVRLTMLDGKAYVTVAGSHDGKPITIG